MSIVVRFAPSNLTAEKYDKVVRLEAEGSLTDPDGRDYHVCCGAGGELMVSEIWDSQEQFEAFVPHLMPLLEQAGIDPGEPTIFEVHNVEKR